MKTEQPFHAWIVQTERWEFPGREIYASIDLVGKDTGEGGAGTPVLGINTEGRHVMQGSGVDDGRKVMGVGMREER